MTTELARPEKRNRVAEESNDGVARAAAGETNASTAAANGSAPAASAGAASNLIIQLVSETGETLGRYMSR